MVLILSMCETRLKFIFYSILSINTNKAQQTYLEIKSNQAFRNSLSEIHVLQLLFIEMISQAIEMTKFNFFFCKPHAQELSTSWLE